MTSLAWKRQCVCSSLTFQFSFNMILTFYISSKDRIRPKRMAKTDFCYDNLFKSYKRLHLVLESESINWRRKLKRVLSWFLFKFSTSVVSLGFHNQTYSLITFEWNILSKSSLFYFLQFDSGFLTNIKWQYLIEWELKG